MISLRKKGGRKTADDEYVIRMKVPRVFCSSRATILFKFRLGKLVPVFGVLWFATTGWALDLRVDFSTGDGSAGNHWNTLSASALVGGWTPLVEHADGSTTGITITGSGWTTDYVGTLNTLPSWWDGGTQAQDRIYFYDNGPAVGTITLAGLSPSQSYLLELFSAGDYVERAITANSAYGVSSITGQEDTAWDGSLEGPNGWLIWNGISPDAQGKVQITIDNLEPHYANVNALRISSVPEPSALSLFVLGLVGVATLRRRQES